MSAKRMICALAAACLLLSTTACSENAGQIRYESGDPAELTGKANVGSNRFTQPADLDSPMSLANMTLEGYEKIAENEKLALYLRQESASIRVVNKENGYIWGALRQDKPDNLNKTWSAFANSIVSIKYYDETGNIIQTGAGHADNACTYHLTEDGVTVDVSFQKAKISLTVRLELRDDHIRFSLDDSSIREEGEFALGQLYFAPFLGSTVGDEIGGYMFVPDGSGALIRFQKPAKYLAGYSDRVYGSDYAIDNLFTVGDLKANRTNDFLKDTETVSMPVYGISHGYDSNALFGYVETGAEYASIFAEPAGIVTDYNYAGACFLYRQVYQQPTGRDGSGIQVVQKNANTINPAVSVYFLAEDTANYTGMAWIYRNILLSQGVLTEGSIPAGTLALDYITADVQKGFLFNSTRELTDPSYIQAAADYLQAQGIGNVQFNLLGWQSGGLNGYNKQSVYSTSQIASFQELSQLRSSLQAHGYDLSLYLAPLTAKDGQVALSSDYGITLSQAIIQIQRDNEEIFLGDTYFLKTDDALKTLKEQVQILHDSGLDSIAIDQLGSMLYGEYLREAETSRAQILKNITDTLQQLAGEQGMTLYDPNAYALRFTTVYRDVPMGSSRYIFETDAVPFLQLVLSGSMTLYAPYANQSFYTDIDVLKCIEYNAYPSFLLTGADSGDLRDTPSEEYFSTCFEDWKESAVSVYQRIDAILSRVHGQQMLSHTALQQGLVQITYSTGSIYVNYNDTDMTWQGIQIPAQSAIYVGA